MHSRAVGGDQWATEGAVDEHYPAVRAQQDAAVVTHRVELAAARLGLTAVTAFPHRASPLLQTELTRQTRHHFG